MNSFDLPTRRYHYDEIAQWPDEARRELDDGTPILLYAPGLCPVAPTIVVEVLSRSTARNDRTLKTREYAAFGIPHYWIIDPVAEILEAFELAGERYTLAGAIGADENYAPNAFAELQIVGTELFQTS